jgi:hypothetical protein
MNAELQEESAMPLYEGRENVENRIRISDQARGTIRCGTGTVIETIADLVAGADGPVALDGWYGVDFDELIRRLTTAMTERGRETQFIPIQGVYKSMAEIAEYKQPFITDDPSFGYCNMEGRISDLMDLEKLELLKTIFQKNNGQDLVVYGYGAAVPELYQEYAHTFYCDMTRQPMLWKMWDGNLIPFAAVAPDKGYGWKEYYYCDYFLLHFQKHFILERMDYYVEAVEVGNLKLMPRESYDEIIQSTLKYPVKEVEIYQPGPWGAYRYKDFWNIEGLECNAWNELAGPELSILVDVGAEEMINMPFVNLMQYADELVGPYLNKTYPHLFPLDAWLDDGYFPKPEPAERISMPIHNHPDTAYVKRHFNEPIGRYETYYIAEAYEGANTWMGFYNDVDLEQWEAKCRDSNNLTVIEDWKDYICNWESRVGDLYLIPPGTDHGHGGNQMVLELDTCPSIAGTEYSFFSYDFARNSWDDNSKTMTGKPLKMHLDHSFNNSRCRREDYVAKKLLARPSVVKWTKEYFIDRYSSVPEMPFEIERIHYYRQGEYDTQGKFCHILTLTAGKGAVIRSKDNPELCSEINLFQAAVIPASFGEYVIESKGDGGLNTATLVRWKRG